MSTVAGKGNPVPRFPTSYDKKGEAEKARSFLTRMAQ
jgi:hypothetical protein